MSASQMCINAINKVQDSITEQLKKACKPLTRITNLLKQRRQLLNQTHINTGTPITQAYDDKPLISSIQTLLNFYIEIDHVNKPYQCQCSVCVSAQSTTTQNTSTPTNTPIHKDIVNNINDVKDLDTFDTNYTQTENKLTTDALIELDTQDQQNLINDINERRAKMNKDLVDRLNEQRICYDAVPITNTTPITDANLPTVIQQPLLSAAVTIDEYAQHRERMKKAQQTILNDIEKKKHEEDRGVLFSINSCRPIPEGGDNASDIEHDLTRIQDEVKKVENNKIENNEVKKDEVKNNEIKMDEVKNLKDDKKHTLGPVFANDIQADLLRELYNDANDLILSDDDADLSMQHALEQAKAIEQTTEQLAQRDIDKPVRNHLGVYEIEATPINALTRLTPRERDKLTYDIFQKAKINIQSAINGKEHEFTEAQIDELVSNEADRLLTLYIKTH